MSAIRLDDESLQLYKKLKSTENIWSSEEKLKFTEAMKHFGGDHLKIAEYVESKTLQEINNYI